MIDRKDAAKEFIKLMDSTKKKRAFNMPFKSEAQRRKFLELVKAGKMSQETLDKWERATGDSLLPEKQHQRGVSIKKVKKIKVK